jgi:hypothetical protein
VDTEHHSPSELLAEGLQRLADLLGPTWTVSRRPGEQGARAVDALVELRPEGDSHFTQLLVELRATVTPRLVEEVLLPKVGLLRQVNHYTNLLVMTPWLSQKTQQMLRKNDVSYLDMTGNVSLRVPRPAIVIYTEGAMRNPRARVQEPTKATLAGPKAGRLVRLLADVRPPYRAGELARESGLSLAYVSRLLDTLGDQLLIRRDGRTIVDVDWPNLLRARAGQTALLKANTYTGMLAPNGVQSVLKGVKELPLSEFDGVGVTGSYAAHSIAPLSAGGQLMLYVAPRLDVDDVADLLGLLPVRENADVLMLRPSDKVVFERARVVDGLQHVALSQLAMDCLSGPGRMPAEGEAVLEYMSHHEARWRASGISDLRRRTRF